MSERVVFGGSRDEICTCACHVCVCVCVCVRVCV